MSEKPARVWNGYLMLIVGIVLLAAVGGVIYYSCQQSHSGLSSLIQ